MQGHFSQHPLVQGQVISGKWYRAGSAANCEARLCSGHGQFTVETAEGEVLSGKLDDIQVADRLGNVERKLTLADGSIFATGDNAAVDSLFNKAGGVSGLLHAWESHLGWVGVALVATVLFVVVFFKWGVPFTSSAIAHALPHKTNELIGAGALDFLDDIWFEPSELDAATQEAIRSHFFNELAPLATDVGAIDYQLHFRLWKFDDKSIPNALALPSGDIILTDKFVQLSEGQHEIDAVLLHEIGHVVQRHSLKMLIEATIVSTVVMMVTGDNSAMVDMGVGVGSLLVNSHYSRGHESEADLYAFERMLLANIDPQVFSSIMQKMTLYMTETDDSERDVGTRSDINDKSRNADNNFLDYLSSHPPTSERIEQARRYSECFKQGLRHCELP